jgi:hypothetical protein
MKALAIFAVFVCLAAMSSHQQATAQKHTDTPRGESTTTITVNNEDHSKHEEQKVNNVPHWWPEQITALAVIASLIVVATQTYYTRIAAQATADAAKATLESVKVAEKSILLQFRPKLSVRSMTLDVSKALAKTDGAVVWRLVMANIGSSPAYIRKFEIVFDSLVQDIGKDVVYSLGTESIDAFTLAAGAIKILDSKISNAQDHVLVAKNFSDTSFGQYVWVRCTAVISLCG